MQYSPSHTADASDAKLIPCPDRYADERGAVMWDTVQRILRELHSTTADLRVGAHPT
jgi:hypothetical protein